MPAGRRLSATFQVALLNGCGCAALMLGAALTQTADPGPARATVTIDEITVTARERAENVQDVPLAITAVRGGTLQNFSPDSVRRIGVSLNGRF